MKSRLGVNDAESLRVPSEFDFAEQAILYLPRRMPSPKSPEFADAVARETIELLSRTQGRAFVLFTSYSMLRAVRERVERELPYPIIVQGHAPRSVLSTISAHAPRGCSHVVVLGGASSTCREHLAADHHKLPFARPVTDHRAPSMPTSMTGVCFQDYQGPLACCMLQGCPLIATAPTGGAARARPRVARWVTAAGFSLPFTGAITHVWAVRGFSRAYLPVVQPRQHQK